MAKVMATQNKAEDTVEQKPVIPVVEKPAEATLYTEESKKANSDFDKKLNNVEADDETGDDKNKADDEKDAEGEKAEAKAEAKDADDEVPAEDDQIDEDTIKSFDRAKELGMTDEQIGDFSSKEDFEKALAILESRQKGTEPEKKTETKDDDKPYDSGLDPDVYDEGIIEQLNKIGKMTDSLKAELKAIKLENSSLKTTVDAVNKRGQAQAQNEHTNWFDGQINSLEGLEDVLGKGTIKDIKKGSDEYKNRAALDEEMRTIAAGYRATNRKIPAKSDLFQMALNIKFPEKIKGAVIASAGKKLDKRASQALGRGSGKGSAVTEIEKAVQANRNFDKDFLTT
jgi:hypothetical protein